MICFEIARAAVQQTVTESRDWLDYMSAFSGVVGALLAGVAIWYAAWQAGKSKRDLIRERRYEFELGLLAEIRHQMSITELDHLSGYVAALIVDPADETDIPVLRAALAIKAGPQGQRRLAELNDVSRGLGDRSFRPLLEVEKEVDAAIQRRLEK